MIPAGEPHSAMLLPVKYVQALERDQLKKLCCRHVEEEGHTAQWFGSQTKDDPDILVITCGGCGRKHRRFFVGNGERVVIKEVR